MSSEKDNLALSLWYLIKVTASKFTNLKDKMMRKSCLHSNNLCYKVIKCSGKTVINRYHSNILKYMNSDYNLV